MAWRVRSSRAFLFCLGFVLQILIAVSIQLGDDIASRFVTEHGTTRGVANAHRLVAFETAHGFWWEPAWQTFFQHTHHLLFVMITWRQVVPVMDRFYIWGHLLITLGVALWIYGVHRRFFALVRNTCIIVNALALFLYHAVPVSPPRLTPGLSYRHHSFTFQDTVFGQSGVYGGYYRFNEFAAMPSVHIAWAVTIAAAVLLLARPIIIKALAVVYPTIVLTVIVVTGNHYLLDAAVGAGIAVVAAGCALVVAWLQPKLQGFVISRLSITPWKPALEPPIPMLRASVTQIVRDRD